MPQVLRDYQQRGLSQILDAWRDGARAVLMTLPTGGGKTSIFVTLAAQLAQAGSPSVILVHRRELATQAAKRLREFGIDFGYIMAGENPRPMAKVQIASVQTLVRRKVPRAALVIADEAHLSTAKTWHSILEQYPKAKILGVTATPWRMSGKPLVGSYDASVIVSTPSELREAGHLCPYNGFSYLTPDLSKVKTTAGEYNEKQSAEAMKAPSIVANIVEQWKAHASTLSTVVFAVTVEHSKALCEEFKAAGVSAEHLDGSTPKLQRDAILKRVEQGRTLVLCNVGVAVEGLDIPRLKCCVLARPTKSLARAIQMMGRVRRPWNGLTARIHDHAFNIKTHGLPDADRDYSLNAKSEDPPSLTQCELCFALYAGPKCSACEHENEPKLLGERELVTVADAEQFDFSSGADAVVHRPPVEISWTEIGKKVEGIFLRQWEEDSQYGKLQTYLVKGAKRDYRFHGTTGLNALMKRVQISDSIRITYTGNEALSGGRTKKIFRLEKDDGAAVELPAHPNKGKKIKVNDPAFDGIVREFCERRCVFDAGAYESGWHLFDAFRRENPERKEINFEFQQAFTRLFVSIYDQDNNLCGPVRNAPLAPPPSVYGRGDYVGIRLAKARA